MMLKEMWICLIHKVITGHRKLRTFLTLIAGLSYVTFASCFVILALPLDRLFQFPQILPTPINILLSIPLVFLGIFLIHWSQSHFFKAKGTPIAFNPPPKLVTNGPYAYARNPMLSGIFILLGGFGIAFGSISLLFIFIPLFIFVHVAEVKILEEPELEKRLGRDYLEYKKRTPMFFPRSWPLFRK